MHLSRLYFFSTSIVLSMVVGRGRLAGEEQNVESPSAGRERFAQIDWRRGTDPPLARGGYYAASYRGGIVLAGGTYWKAGEKFWTDRVDFYDPKLDAWSKLPALPRRLAYGGMVRVGESLYLLGGARVGMAYREIYRFQGERWEQVGETPAPLFYTAAVAVGSRIYLLAGGGSISDLSKATREAWVADTRDFRWQQLNPLPGVPRVIHTAAAVGKSIYVFGGCHQKAGQEITNLNDAYRLDTVDGSWHRLADAPLPVRAWWAEAAGDVIYLFGGYSDQFLDRVYRYDPAEDSYTLISNIPLGLCDTKFLLHTDGNFYGIAGEDKMASRFDGTLIGHPRP